MLYTTTDGDVLDRIVWRQYGRPAWTRMRGLVEAALAANPHLAHLPPVLPRGTVIALPAVTAAPLPAPQIKLWD